MQAGPFGRPTGEVVPVTVPCRLLMPLVAGALRHGSRVTFTATGSSMRPFLRDGDLVELEAVHQAAPSVGDIVLATDSSGAWRLHRVIRIGIDGIFLAGDAQRRVEGPFLQDQLLGRVVGVQRRGRVMVPDRILWRLLGLLWIRCAPVGHLLLDLLDDARRIGGRLRLRAIH